MVLAGAVELPALPSMQDQGLSSATLGNQMNAGGGEGFLTGTLWEKQNLCCGSLTARPAPSPREPVRRHKPRQLAPDIGEGM